MICRDTVLSSTAVASSNDWHLDSLMQFDAKSRLRYSAIVQDLARSKGRASGLLGAG
jgi:hypothetical protein